MPADRLKPRLFASLSLALLLASAAAAGLRDDVYEIVQSTDLGGATVGVSVVEAGSGGTLVEINADQPFIPASNMKVLTSGAALHTLGPDFRFETKLLLDGDRLIIVGDGDPAFGDPTLLSAMTDEDGVPLDCERFLQLWVGPVAAADVKEIRELVVDDRVFDRQFVHPSWDRKQLNLKSFAEPAGLSFHLNMLYFYPEPRRGERPAISSFEPHADWLRIRNRATSAADDRNSAWIARRFWTNELTMYGNVKSAYRTPLRVTVHDMPTFFGRLLADRLEDAGLTVHTVRAADPMEARPEGDAIGPVIYTPIASVVTRCNRDSQNLYAESLLKRMGHEMTGQPGSWLNGSSIVRHVIHERLERPDLVHVVRIADGSGLSRDNRVAPAVLCAWLNSLHDDERLGEVFLQSLAVGGETGTLGPGRRDNLSTARLGGAIVHAKSGYINGVSCLSGYVTGSAGRCCCFSILVNDIKGSTWAAKAMQDRIVKAIADEISTPATALGSD
jgi:D-alanyl-D-alanine carboxypeptidase/D-alanyl-D-alanine-endopeptidase (penicillin-binding protein 4)